MGVNCGGEMGGGGMGVNCGGGGNPCDDGAAAGGAEGHDGGG